MSKKESDIPQNAWHHVYGMTPDKFVQAEREAEYLYGDIIEMEHPTSARHPRMAAANRAAQFAPFAALTGFEDVIGRTASEHKL